MIRRVASNLATIDGQSVRKREESDTLYEIVFTAFKVEAGTLRHDFFWSGDPCLTLVIRF